jgi:alginate O-acetyltransferase complex protein AlgI
LLFNSWAFVVFLPIVLTAYYSLRHRWQNRLLVLASYFFYGWWDWRFCSLLLLSTVVDFWVGRRLGGEENQPRRKSLLLLSCFTNLGILGFFKYFNFFADSAAQLFQIFGLKADTFTLSIVLPVGISFYTFQTMSYTIDVYRRRMKPVDSMVDFAVYVAFFPQLVAGPIERATRLLPQVQKHRHVDWEDIRSGSLLILLGLFRKVAIADGLAPLVNRVFSDPGEAGSAQLLIALYSFSLQIYGDFAGYSDIARGTARLLGFDLMINFQHPYFSTNITEFWRRWHISLSSWLRDYLYITLGGNRGGTIMTYRNLMLTMLIGGLWHGAGWAFVIWGGLHGLYLAGHKLLLGSRQLNADVQFKSWKLAPRDLLGVVITFHLVALTWIFFRATEFDQAWTYLTGIINWHDGSTAGLKRLAVSGFLLLVIDVPQYVKRDHTVVLRWPWILRGLLMALLILCLFGLRSYGKVPFIYFQF